MKKAFITKGLIVENYDAALIIADGQTITEAVVSDYATLFETNIEIEVNSDDEIIITAHPVNCDFDIDDVFSTTGSCNFSRTWNKFDEYYEIEIEIEFDYKFSDKLDSLIRTKIEAYHEDDDLDEDPDQDRD